MGARTVLTLQPTAWGMTRDHAAAGARGKTLARPMGAVAIRVPERVSANIAELFPTASPHLFVHEGARQALERRLMKVYPGPVSLSITDNRHAIVSHHWERGMLRARVHHMFLDAPPSIVNALVRYVTHSDRDSSLRIGHYIEENGGRLARPRHQKLVTAGEHHDLLALFNDLNARYFNNSVNALITWGKAGRRPAKSRSRHTIKLGSYSSTERLIRIHPALDKAWVPRYFVAYIVYHEMLHHVIPAKTTERQRKGGEGRRQLHPPEFRERETHFRHFERALRWEKAHIGRLLRS
ncbi:hypothetical protein LZC95_44320 [Pendulispora brunnea]|uniref:M48 family peptidase n=1 Tax=Pendulispora brunnea TaxID=2905690 RepID=A0ABZ2K5V8_9BACT